MLTATLIRNVAVPRALLSNPARFGGVIDGACQRGDLLIHGDRVIGLTRASLAAETRVIAGDGILLPPLVEPHLHLDKAFTLPRIGPVGGDLLASVAAQEADKSNWTEADLRARATRALTELAAAGVSHARSHVDWGSGGDPAATPLAWNVLREVAQDWKGRVELQLSCLPEIDVFADPAAAARIGATVARDGGCLGAWSLHHAHRAAGFAAIFAQADRHGLPLDFHVDEGQEADLDGLAMITAQALRTRFQGPILCGHAVSLMNLAADGLHTLLADMARARIQLCALPTTNLYLQSRGHGTPDRRGITRLAEAATAGVNTCLGTDNVQDAFYPLGRHDPLVTLAYAIPALHLDPPFDRHLPLITLNAAAAVGVAPVWIDMAAPRQLYLARAGTLADMLTAPAVRQPLHSLINADAGWPRFSGVHTDDLLA